MLKPTETLTRMLESLKLSGVVFSINNILYCKIYLISLANGSPTILSFVSIAYKVLVVTIGVYIMGDNW